LLPWGIGAAGSTPVVYGEKALRGIRKRRGSICRWEPVKPDTKTVAGAQKDREQLVLFRKWPVPIKRDKH
jgi:hypothetical protein